MSYQDPHRPDRDRGAYTPPTDDDLPFNRGFDPRRGGRGGGKSPPVTLLVSAGVLVVLILAVVVFYRSGLRASDDAPPAVGQPVGDLKVEAPIEAQPVDPEAGVDVYAPAPAADQPPVFTPPPEEAAPRPLPPVEAAPARSAPTTPAPTPTPAPARPAEPAAEAPGAGGGSAAVQIGAFSSTAVADREYAAIAGRFPAFARGATKRVQEVTASNGSTVYRTTFTGLSPERARAFCQAIRDGGGDCLVR